jgi:MFS family permease
LNPTSPHILGGVDVGDPHIRRGLLFSFCEGLTTTGMLAMTETFSVAAAISLHASPMVVSLISALPLGIGYVCLYLAPALANPARGRKAYVLMGIRLQAILLMACAFTGWLPPRIAPYVYIAVFVIAAVSSHATGAFWVAWMGDLIPPSVRGRHWAWRSTWFACMSLACSLTAGFVARKYNAQTAPWVFFCGIFIAASLFRFGGLSFLHRQYEPPAARPLEVFSPLRFRPKGRFLAFSLASAGFLGTASMTVPFFSVWYLRDLHFNYLWLSLASSAGALGSIALTRRWGRLSDRLGSARVLAIGGLLSAFTPLPSLFFDRPLLICLANFCAGGIWAGYSLANFNHLLALTENDQRHHYIAFNSLISGLIASGFALLGGFLATRLPPLFGWRLRSLFLGAAILRFAIWLIFFRSVPRPEVPAGAGSGGSNLMD